MFCCNSNEYFHQILCQVPPCTHALFLVNYQLNPFTPKLKKYILPTFWNEMYQWEGVRIGSMVIFRRRSYVKACHVIFLVQRKFEIDHFWEWNEFAYHGLLQRSILSLPTFLSSLGLSLSSHCGPFFIIMVILIMIGKKSSNESH